MRDVGLSEDQIRTRFPTAPGEDDIERRPMGVHDALEVWAEGRLSVERALELTGAHDVAEMLVMCHTCDVSRPLITARPECLPDSVVERLQAIADEHPDAVGEAAGGGYPP